MIQLTAVINIQNAGWQSDWSGYEVGYPEVSIVGLYTQERNDGEYSFYIDMNDMNVLDFWKEDIE